MTLTRCDISRQFVTQFPESQNSPNHALVKAITEFTSLFPAASDTAADTAVSELNKVGHGRGVVRVYRCKVRTF